MYEDPNCQDCRLWRGAKNVCLPSRGPLEASLAIFLDSPSVVEDKRGRSFCGDNAEMLDFQLRRMGIDPRTVYVDYILKCYAKKYPGKKHEKRECFDICSQYRFATLQDMPNLRTVCGLGTLACEALIGSKAIGDYAGSKWEPCEPAMRKLLNGDGVWIGYSPGYAIHSPAEGGAVFRVLWKAAEEAGLNPVVTKTKMFEYNN